MLTSTQVNKLQELIEENPRMSAKQLLSYITDNLANMNLGSDAVSSRTKNCVNQTKPAGFATDITSESERERGVKVQTQGRSQQAEADRNPM